MPSKKRFKKVVKRDFKNPELKKLHSTLSNILCWFLFIFIFTYIFLIIKASELQNIAEDFVTLILIGMMLWQLMITFVMTKRNVYYEEVKKELKKLKQNQD